MPETPGVTEAQRAAVGGILEPVADRVELAFFSGSLVAGLGHGTSDVDVHVILADGDQLEERTFQRDGTAIQLTTMGLSLFREIAELGSRLVARRGERTQFELNSKMLWHVFRAGVGAFITGRGEALKLFDSLDRDVLRQVLMGNRTHPVARFANDALGLLEVGDVRSAYLCAHQSLESAVEVVLAAEGDLYSVSKFQLARLARSSYAASLGDLWRLLYAGPAEPTREDVDLRLAYANTLVSYSLVHGWDTPPAAPAPLPAPVSGVRRSPYFGLLRFSDGYALPGPGRSLKISPQVAQLWAQLDGKPQDETLAALHGGADGPAGKALADLARAGAVLGLETAGR